MAITHTIAISALAGAAALGLFKQGGTSQHVPTFAQLKPGESVDVDFVSSGCFNIQRYELKFTRANDLSVNVKSISHSTGKDGKAVLKTINLGNLKLAQTDINGLDSLIQFYRSKPKDGCTTVDTIILSHRRGGQLLAREKFKDGSCSYQLPNVVRVTDLVARFNPKNSVR
jgi:hypothetical protein